MAKIRKRFGSLLLALCMVLTMLPTAVFAADASGLESMIEGYMGGTGSLYVSVSGSTVTVTGTVTDASSSLNLNIDSGVTVIWKASITATSSYSGSLILLSGEGAFEVVEGGTISATTGFTIINNSSDVQLTVNGGTVSTATGYAIYAVSSNGGSYAVTVESGTVTAAGGIAINADRVTVNGGTVSASGNNSCAINGSNGSLVEVSGGTVSADHYYAIELGSYDNTTVLVSGGKVISLSTDYGAIRAQGANSEVNVNGGVVLSYANAIDVTDGFSGTTGDGVVISWNSNAYNTLYIAGTAKDLSVLPEGVVIWAMQDSKSGISYAKGSNTGFFAIDGITVVASLSEAANTLASAITNYDNNLQTSVNDAVVTVTGTVENATSTLSLNILEGISVQWKASITANTLTDNLIYLYGLGSFEVADGGTISSVHSTAIYAKCNVTINGGTVSSADSTGIFAQGEITVSGGVVSSEHNFAIAPKGNVTISGGTIRSTDKLPIATGYIDIDNLTITGGTIFFYGTEMNVYEYSLAQSGDSVIIVWDQSIGTTQYDIGSSTDLVVSPATAPVTWIKQDDVSGISYAKGSNTGFLAVDGVTVSKGSVKLSQLSYTDPSTIVFAYNGKPRGIGTVTAADGFTLGTITVYYTGINGTSYAQSTTAPTNTGTYQVTVDVAENVNYDAVSGLVLGEYIIHKVSASGVNQDYDVLANSAKEYIFDLTTLLPDGVDAAQVSGYEVNSYNDNNGIFSAIPYVSGTTLMLTVESSTSTAGQFATVVINFTSANYEISNAIVTIKTTDKTPVSITADMSGGVYNSQPYVYSNAVVTTNTDSSNVTDSVTLEASYEGVDGTVYGPSATAPEFAGSYQLTLSVLDSDATYTGSAIFTFTIAKRPVTVKADDKSVTVGSDPGFTYTVDGQLSGETALIGEPYLAFAEGNTTKAGSYTIDVFLIGVSYTENYKAADPAYVNGTLTVSAASAGGDTTYGGGSTASTPTPISIPTVSGATATTTVSAQTGSNGMATASITQSQLSSAVTAAQNAAKSTGGSPRVEIQVSGGSDASAVETTLQKSAVQALITGEMESLILSGPIVTMTFDANAISTIAGNATGDVIISAARVENSTLSDIAAQVVGDRPVYNLNVTSGSSTISQFDGTVTVLLPYTPAEGEDANAIVIYYINANGEPELMQNCRYDAKTGNLVFTTTHFSTYALGYNKVAFSDVDEDAWCYDAVTFLAAREITGGTSADTFSPDATLTRGQFITLLLRAYGVTADENPMDNFSDAGNMYYTGYLAAAKALGVSNGVGHNKFQPEQAITRQEMFTLIYNALEILEKLPEGNSDKTLSDFTDSGDISSYAKEAMNYLVKNGIVGGSNGQLSPMVTTTRAQMAQILYNLLGR